MQMIDFEKDIERFSRAAREYVEDGRHVFAKISAQLAARCAFLVHPELRTPAPPETTLIHL